MNLSAIAAPPTVAQEILSDASRSALPALIGEDGRIVTYGTLADMVRRLQASLFDVGVGKARGERAALVLPRGPGGLVAFLAGSALAACCPLHPGMRADEFEAYFAMMGVDVLLDGTGSSAALAAAQELGLASVSFSWNGGDIAITTSGSARSCVRAEIDGAPDETALILQTSGTTSKPKLVALTHANIISAARGIVDWFHLSPDDICLNPMPLHHLHGLVTAGLSSLLAGSAVCCTEGFAPATFHAALDKLQPTWFTGSPTMHLALREFYGRGDMAMPCERLRFFRSSSAPLAASVIAELETLFQAPLMETYGLTETGSMICANPLPPGIRKQGSVGVEVGAEIRVVDASGAQKPVGEQGEIAIRGPSVIRRYLGPAEISEPYFFGDWLRTGDVGYLDADGYLFLVGRTKELIKRGGLSVYPDEVDNVLTYHPAIAESVTFAVPHPTLGEELVAAVVPKRGQTPTETQLKGYLAGQLSSYKVPAAILIVSALPKTETGKVRRREAAGHFADAFRPRNEAPSSPSETVLLGLWRRMLERADFGVTDNVLLFGGDPLRAASVSDALRDLHGRHLSAKDMIAHPTVREMGAMLSGREHVA